MVIISNFSIFGFVQKEPKRRKKEPAFHTVDHTVLERKIINSGVHIVESFPCFIIIFEAIKPKG